MFLPPFDIPDEVIIDSESGYAVNIPLGFQGYPGWQHDLPDVIQRIMLLREELGVVIEDDHFCESPFRGRPSDALQDYVERHGLQEREEQMAARVRKSQANRTFKDGRPVKRILPTSKRARATGSTDGPIVVEPISAEEADLLLNEWFEQVVFVDAPDEELPELEPEDDDEPQGELHTSGRVLRAVEDG